ncbi:MAG: hypothetical protein KC620_05195 [Myxococcales bacterium]|nr:hypothetical protein [Myxococcales bacterium]
MSGFDWSAVRELGPDCPSEPALERLHLGAGEPAALAELRAHAEGCPHCTAYLARLAQGFDVVPEVDPRALLAGVRRRLDDAPVSASGAVARWWRWLFIAVPVAAVVALLVLRPKPPIEAPPDAPRFKGDFALAVHRQVPGGSEPLLSGEPVAPGEHLRLEVTLPRDGRVAVYGREASGAVYRAWPFDDPWATLPAGRHQALDGAIELDEAPGQEALALVFCPGEAVEPVCSAGEQGLACPEACRTERFVLNKQR